MDNNIILEQYTYSLIIWNTLAVAVMIWSEVLNDCLFKLEHSLPIHQLNRNNTLFKYSVFSSY